MGKKHSRPQTPRSFWSAPRIATSGLVQRHSGFEWLCKYNRLRPEPIRFGRLGSEHSQSEGKSVNRGLLFCALVGLGQRSRFLVLTKRSAASGDENGVKKSFKSSGRMLTKQDLRSPNLVPRAHVHVPFGQDQDTELCNNQFSETKILGLPDPVSRRMRGLIYMHDACMASRDKVDVDMSHKGIQYALEKLEKSKFGFERTAVSNFKSKKTRGLWERD